MIDQVCKHCPQRDELMSFEEWSLKHNHPPELLQALHLASHDLTN